MYNQIQTHSKLVVLKHPNNNTNNNNKKHNTKSQNRISIHSFNLRQKFFSRKRCKSRIAILIPTKLVILSMVMLLAITEAIKTPLAILKSTLIL